MTLRNSNTLLKTTLPPLTIPYNHPAQWSLTWITLHCTIPIHMSPIGHPTRTQYIYHYHSKHTLYHTRNPHHITSLNTPQLLKDTYLAYFLVINVQCYTLIKLMETILLKLSIIFNFNIKFMFSLLLTFISELIYLMSIVSKGHWVN